MIRLSTRDYDDPLPALIFTIGIPGSGKSTWIKSILQQDDSHGVVVVSPDEIRRELTGNISDQTVNYKAWVIAKRRVSEALQEGKDVILDATNVGSSNRRKFVKDLPPHSLYAKRFEVEPEESMKRVKKDLDEGIDRSRVPDDVITRMSETFKKESTEDKLKAEGFQLL